MQNILSKPKLIIPIFAAICALVILLLYPHLGKAPVISDLNTLESSPNTIPENLVSLAFQNHGKLESLAVKVGDIVHKGDVLARLSAPDAEGAINQAKGQLELAKAQYASLNSQYSTIKSQQDRLVKNAYLTLLTSDIEGVPSEQDNDVPIISGTYTCDKEGSYILDPYPSKDNDSGFSFTYTGLEKGIASVKYDNPVPLGNCGLQIKFEHNDSFYPSVNWTIDIPNTKGASYLANKNAYELALINRDKALTDLSKTIGNGDGNGSVAESQINAAEGAYQAALGAYDKNLIIAPVDGTIVSIDPNLKVGQSISQNKKVIDISSK